LEALDEAKALIEVDRHRAQATARPELWRTPVIAVATGGFLAGRLKLERHHEALRRGRVRLQIALRVVAKAGEPLWFDLEIVYATKHSRRRPTR
jgi:hypothetical protein